MLFFMVCIDSDLSLQSLFSFLPPSLSPFFRVYAVVACLPRCPSFSIRCLSGAVRAGFWSFWRPTSLLSLLIWVLTPRTRYGR